MNKEIRKTNKKAFSIAEVCVVCGIMGILLVPVFMIMSKSNSGTIRNKNEILSQQYASNILSYLCLQKYDGDELQETENKDMPNSMEITVNKQDHSLNRVIMVSDIEENFKKISKITYSVKEFASQTDDWPYSYKVATVFIKWQQPGEREMTTTMSVVIPKR